MYFFYFFDFSILHAPLKKMVKIKIPRLLQDLLRAQFKTVYIKIGNGRGDSLKKLRIKIEKNG